MLKTRRTRKIIRRLDAWAGNAAFMADTGNMIMFSVYVDRIFSTVDLLKDFGIISEVEASRLLSEYAEYWTNFAPTNSGPAANSSGRWE